MARGSRPTANRVCRGSRTVADALHSGRTRRQTRCHAGNIVVLVCVLPGERHEQVATDVVDSEWRKTRGDSWVRKDVDDVEVAVEDFHLAEAEVRRIQELAGGRGHEREALIDRTVIAL